MIEALFLFVVGWAVVWAVKRAAREGARDGGRPVRVTRRGYGWHDPKDKRGR